MVTKILFLFIDMKRADVNIVDTMYVDVCKTGKNVRYLLRESYREGGKVKKRTLANISHCSKEEIEAIKLALKHKHNLKSLCSTSKDITLEQGKSFGAVWLVYQMAKKLGIVKALTHSEDAKLALWQVIARVIDQGSRLSAVRLASRTPACDVLGITKSFDENNLYNNLDWICKEQSKIEDRLFKQRSKSSKPGLYLYDVTSSYLEGDHNELAAFGYNRDGKKAKKQIVIGLLTDEEGTPLSVEVFDGNRQDSTTLSSQIHKIAERFGGTNVTLVGDRGMIKSKQVEDLLGTGIHYITAITRSQIQTLVNSNTIDMSLFDHELAEIETENKERYILRRNPFRQGEIKSCRESKLSALSEKIKCKNKYLLEHHRSSALIAKKNIEAYLDKLKLGKWVSVESENRELKLVVDKNALDEESKLDGCYVLKTDLKKEEASKSTIHSRYKSLSKVESAFRIIKTKHLEVRPINVRLKERTRGHVFVVMLAYLIIKELEKCWQNLDITVQEGIVMLGTLCVTNLFTNGVATTSLIPKPNQIVSKLLKAAEVHLPVAIPSQGASVVTRQKLTKCRKTY